VAGPLGGFDAQGNPAPLDWSITIDAPPGSYDFLCFIHPGMQGSVRVVDNDDKVTTQAENDARGDAQFAHDQAEAKAAETAANTVRFSGGAPGSRTYDVDVSVGVPDLHAVVLEMLPQKLNLKDGDRVQYRWAAPNEVHTVSFPAEDPRLPPPFGFDCGGSGFQAPGAGPPCLEPGHTTPELIGDPGNAPPGTLLTSPTALVDSGLLVGRAYHLEPSRRTWSVRTNGATAPGTYEYQCTVHDFMVGALNIAR
jgi:plastocyanin